MLLATFLIAAGVLAAADAAPALPADKGRFLLFLLIGQSNMAGRGKPLAAEDTTPHPRVLMLAKDDTWKPAIDPLHFDKPVAGVGLGLTFGKTVAEAVPDCTVGLIPCAVGGTSLTAWVDLKGRLGGEACRRARRAQQDGTLAGILWHQGESGPDAQAYPALFERFVQDLRAELVGGAAVPLVLGTLGDGSGKAATAMNPMLKKLPERVPRSACVDAAGLAGDLHFTAASYRELGRRYAAELLRLRTMP